MCRNAFYGHLHGTVCKRSSFIFGFDSGARITVGNSVFYQFIVRALCGAQTMANTGVLPFVRGVDFTSNDFSVSISLISVVCNRLVSIDIDCFKVRL